MSEWYGEWNSNSRRFLAATTIMMVLSTIVFLLRLESRRRLRANFWWDDYRAGIALFFSYGPNIATTYAIHFGLGRHESEVGEQDALKTLELAWVAQLLWQFAMPFIKLSLLCFYRRLFPNKWLLRIAQFIGAFVLALMVAGTIVHFKACTPLAYYWDPTMSAGHCLNYETFHITSGAINTVTDAIVLCLPLPVVWRLKTSISRKIGLSFAFALGGFTCVASIIRLINLIQMNSMDVTYSTINVGIWVCVEVSTGVIACNIPAIAPLFLNLWRKFMSHSPESSQPRGYVLSQNIRNRYKKFSDSRINKHRYGKNAGLSTMEFGEIKDLEACEDTVGLAVTAQPVGDAKDPPKPLQDIPPICINVRNELEQTSRPKSAWRKTVP